ncbi:granzyme K isoform X1 [Dipodomys spectabilis]|uniref:granzyme K isoform X1 n=1 Tax=Dipodomys spectabilis TaxID=105255 RepID=UPI001C5458CE|nr:granzyme K isoform X1 [Dipodomys spectabilis]
MTMFSSFLFVLIAGAYITPECFSMEIIGGRQVRPHSRPFMASIQYDGNHVCGGVLIHPQWVLTAAHCHSSRFTNGQTPTVVLGAHSLSKNEPSKQTFRIKKFIPFSRLPSEAKSNDIMLIKLHSAAELNKHVQLLPLRSKNYIRDGAKCQVTGWGSTNPDSLNISDTLQEVTITVISRKRCNSQSYYNHNPVITKDMICAGDVRGQKDSCQGDSGGPLICKGIFHAIVSAGHKCGIAKKPGIYTLLTKKYQAWITSKLAPSHAR